ncbi:MAG: hypothetical protein AAF755_10495 [Pseudomonadota bacterium]
MNVNINLDVDALHLAEAIGSRKISAKDLMRATLDRSEIVFGGCGFAGALR